MSSGNLLRVPCHFNTWRRYPAQRAYCVKGSVKTLFSNQTAFRLYSCHIATYLAKERAVAIEAVERASNVCQSVFKRLVAEETLTKNDKSPVTVADFGAQAVVNSILEKHFPLDPIVGEEDSKDLQGDAGRVLREKVVELVNTATEAPMSTEEVS
ncbi:3'(2'),5'-bisphosphate nucleotidase [Coemansia sp. RSA 486]|nr:3'(2'),5'-bisphosphate nucleotidase [Coemansia sp. RSA 486]